MTKEQLEKVKKIIGYLTSEDEIVVAGYLIDKINSSKESDEEEKSTGIVSVLQEFLDKSEEVKEKQKFMGVVEKFNSLSEEQQEKVIKMVASIFVSEVKSCDRKKSQKEKKAATREICKKEGHKFSDWEEINWISPEVVFEGENAVEKDIPHTAWKRTCEVCHCVRKVKNKPQELVEKEAAAKVKKLESKPKGKKKK